MTRMKGDRWRAAELNVLLERGSEATPRLLTAQINRINKQGGFALRTETAVRVKMKRLGISARPVLNNFPRDELARILAVDRERARGWTRLHGLKYFKGAQLVTIRVADFRTWAYKHSEQLAGIDAERLNWLMNDPKFCQRVAAMARPRQGVAQPIIRADTGAWFPSIKAAARRSHLHPSSIRRSLNEGRLCDGTQWRYQDSTAELTRAKQNFNGHNSLLTSRHLSR